MNMKRIILSGGGTLGSVSPLIAIYEEMHSMVGDMEFLWVGTSRGLEKDMVCGYGIPFKSISSGKFRRYFSFWNFIDPFFIALGFIQSLFILLRYKPKIVLTAGGFVSVPLVWASWVLHIPIIAHQQDVRIGLANKLMAPLAKFVTVSFEEDIKYFKGRAVYTGNPLRSRLMFRDKERAEKFFKFDKNIPTILIMGGGTGAAALNSIVAGSLEKLLPFCQVIHSLGYGKNIHGLEHPRYRSYEFLNKDNLAMAYAAADLVVCRAGMSTLTELSYLGKPAIIIPIPDTHQEENANEFKKRNAARVLEQEKLLPEEFIKIIKETLDNKKLLEELSQNIMKMFPRDATGRVVGEIMKFL